MDCNDTRRLLDADADGELDLVHHLELAAHLRGCPECSRIAAAGASRRAALRQKLPYYAAPAGLAERIRAALPDAPAAARSPAPVRTAASEPRRSLLFLPGWGVAGLAVSLACGLVLGIVWGEGRARAHQLIGDIVSAHVRSLQVDHLTDVASTDQHTVKPWFAGKLAFSPPVVDLAAAGFPLVGGRLEHVDGRPAAALVFRRRQHAINVFVWPAGSAALPERTAARDGYRIEAWSQAGFNCVAVSEIPVEELARFVAAFRVAESR